MTDSRTRILLLTNDSTICGTEQMILSLLQTIDREKYDVRLVTLFGPGDLVEQANALGILSVNLNMKEAGIIQGLKRWFGNVASFQPHVIHSFLHYSNLLVRLTRLRHSGIRVITGIRTVYTMNEYGLRYAVLEWLTHGIDDRMIANSDAGRLSAIESFGLAEDKVSMIPNGIGLDPFGEEREIIRAAVREDIGFHEGDTVIGIVAQLRPAKRHDLLIQVFAELAKEYPALKLWIVGGGERENALREQARTLSVRDRVIFSGYRTDARRLLRGMDIFVLPSDVEGIPVSVMEAMEASLPVVVSRIGGIPTLVEDGTSGLLFEAGNPVALAVCIRKLLVNETLQQNLATAARSRIEERFSAPAMARAIEQLYEDVLA